MRRRHLLFSGGCALLGIGVAGGAWAARLHESPKQSPKLTEEHLASLSESTLPSPRVLFVGNSLVLMNDLPAVVRDLAAREGRVLATGTAAAGGARLVQTVRLPGMLQAVRAGWDAVVVQDFTRTPLRLSDRWASARAVGMIARAAGPAPILLYPPWPARADHFVYRDPGPVTVRPDDPTDYAARTMAHYQSMGRHVVPVPDAWLAAPEEGRALYARDGLHPSKQGTALAARLIWDHLKTMI